ncbi:hypothetical protein AXF42_Ash006798 [Apostasia shenzhenica]|uniref:Uncharacterized protein n=1 Tax=Apostasia shenzhenica TaxID=1088818 RepID=A0A2I0AJF4_9ASPA|nr:hypothetical protein AXF42_Ash006798 [Apostasia shenzhenica]
MKFNDVMMSGFIYSIFSIIENCFSLTSVLSACIGLTDLKKGKQIYGFVIRSKSEDQTLCSMPVDTISYATKYTRMLE